MRRIPPRIGSCLALGGAWLVFFGPAIFTSKVLFDRDLLMTEIPLRAYLRERLAHGQLAQWFPYEMLGTPFVGTVIASAFHPRTLLFLCCDAFVSTKWSILLAYLVGLIGAYRLARQAGASRVGSVAGAFVFALSGCAISYSNKTNMLMGLVCVPWMLAAVGRLTRRRDLRDIVSLGVWWALIFLGGDPQIFLECGLVGCGLLIAGGLRRWSAVAFVAGGALAALLAAVELWPSLAIGDDSIRAYWKQTPYLATSWALHPLRLAELVVPHFLPESIRIEMGRVLEGRIEFFVEWVFVGGVAAALAILGAVHGKRRAIVWIVTVLLGLWLAMGSHGGLIEVWWKVLPFFAKFRYPEKYVGIVVVALVPLVAWGVDEARSRPQAGRIVAAVGAVVLVLGLLVRAQSLVTWGLSVGGLAEKLDAALQEPLAGAWATGLRWTGAGLLILGGVIALLRREGRVVLAIPALVFLELWSGNSGHMPLVDKEVAEDNGPIGRALVAQHQPEQPAPRVIPANIELHAERHPPEDEVRLTHLTLDADDAARTGIDVYSTNEPGEQWRVMRTFYGKKGVPSAIWAPRFNACYRVASETNPPQPDEEVLTPVFERGMALVRRPCLPRAYCARTRRVEDAAAAQARMREGLPSDLVVWEGGPELDSAEGTVTWLAAEPERQQLRVQAPRPTALVITDAFATGWSATIDGRPATIYATNAAARGLFVPAGEHVMQLEYQSPGLAGGAVLSLVGLLVAAALFFQARKTVR